MDIVEDNLSRFDQIRKIKTNRQLTKTQLMSTYWWVIKFIRSRLIFTIDIARKDSWFNYLHKGDPVLIISMDVIKTEQGLYANQMVDPELKPR
jgi:hypothetical protein